MRQFTGLIIEPNENKRIFNYSMEDYDNDRLSFYCINKGYGEYDFITDFEINNRTYLVFGWPNGDNFVINRFDTDYEGLLFGDLMFICIDTEQNNDPKNIVIEDIRDYYLGEDLAATELMDEMDGINLGDDYEMDGFVVSDSEPIIYDEDYIPENDIMNYDMIDDVIDRILDNNQMDID